MKFLSLGEGRLVRIDKIVAILDAEDIKNQEFCRVARVDGNLIDCTGGNKGRTIIILEEGQYILSSVNDKTVYERMKKMGAFDED